MNTVLRLPSTSWAHRAASAGERVVLGARNFFEVFGQAASAANEHGRLNRLTDEELAELRLSREGLAEHVYSRNQ